VAGRRGSHGHTGVGRMNDVPREDFDRELDEISRQIAQERKGKRRRAERREPPNTAVLIQALKVLHGEVPPSEDENER